MKGRNSGALTNLIALSIVLSILKLASPDVSLQNTSLLPTVSAMELNLRHKSSSAGLYLPQPKQRTHPLVQQSDGEEAPAPDMSNNSNPFNFPFQDYAIYQGIRKDWGAFLLGARADYFASNATTCFINSLNLAQYDVELLIVKLMYGDVKNNILNTTLFLKNVSDLSYICLDAMENNYVFWVYKMDSFGRDTTQIVLGALQNVLGNVLKINKLVQQAVAANDNNK